MSADKFDQIRTDAVNFKADHIKMPEEMPKEIWIDYFLGKFEGLLSPAQAVMEEDAVLNMVYDPTNLMQELKFYTAILQQINDPKKKSPYYANFGKGEKNQIKLLLNYIGMLEKD